jgi:hypothetical protein
MHMEISSDLPAFCSGPYVNRQFCELFKAFNAPEPVARGNISAAFSALLSSIAAKRYRPFFDPAEINGLMEREILQSCSAGRYRDRTLSNWAKNPLDLGEWNELLRYPVHGAVASFESLQSGGGEEDRAKHQHGLRRLKIIEDWIYYNQVVQVSIRQQLVVGLDKGI